MNKPQVKDLGVTTKDGQLLHSLTLKTKVAKDGSVSQGLSVGDEVIVEKVFAEGFENNKFDQPSYGCRVIYDDKLCGFFLNAKQHDVYKNVGGAGDKIKIIAYMRDYTYNNEKKQTLDFKFELVE